MNFIAHLFRRQQRSALSRRRIRMAAARLNPVLNVMLAFWAQFHCRHARPPRPCSH
ncbi:hypothetical protein ACFOLG_11310 [Vogesella facilis]|uniref:Uncharacterized protein n=1 Tax=Vogesella facilis TaxID=1655232 RepID=A0ABV7RHG3_9NEIS